MCSTVIRMFHQARSCRVNTATRLLSRTAFSRRCCLEPPDLSRCPPTSRLPFTPTNEPSRFPLVVTAAFVILTVFILVGRLFYDSSYPFRHPADLETICNDHGGMVSYCETGSASFEDLITGLLSRTRCRVRDDGQFNGFHS